MDRKYKNKVQTLTERDRNEIDYLHNFSTHIVINNDVYTN